MGCKRLALRLMLAILYSILMNLKLSSVLKCVVKTWQRQTLENIFSVEMHDDGRLSIASA